MSVKSIVVEAEDIVKRSKFPMLMRYVSNSPANFVVLFYKENVGMVVADKYETWGVGHYSDAWVMSNMERFDGVVELSNG